MLLKGSIIDCLDNSGCDKLKIIQLYSNKLSHAGEDLRGVLNVFNPEKNKLQKKHYKVACITVRQYTKRFSDYLVRMAYNGILMLTDNCKKLIGTRIFGPLQREAVRLVKLDTSLVHKMILLSRYVL
jgi:ribosomal protein L14